MAGEGGVSSNSRSFIVADFPDQNDIRILTDNSPQGVRERISAGFGDLRLGNSFDFVFNRVFNGDDLHFRRIELVYDGVKSGCFSRSRRAGVQDDSVWLAHFVGKLVIGQTAKPQIVEPESHGLLIQKAHHDIFPEVSRKDGDSHINLVSFMVNGKTSVLGDVADVYFHSRHHFHARKDVVIGFGRKNGDVLENSVQPVAESDSVLLGLEVNITRVHLEGAGDDDVQNFSGRNFSDSFFEINDILEI